MEIYSLTSCLLRSSCDDALSFRTLTALQIVVYESIGNAAESYDLICSLSW